MQMCIIKRLHFRESVERNVAFATINLTPRPCIANIGREMSHDYSFSASSASDVDGPRHHANQVQLIADYIR